MTNKKQAISGQTRQRELSDAQRRAIAAIITTRNFEDAATAADVARRSLGRWVAEDELFRRELETARERMLTETLQRLAGITATAVETLADLMTSRRETVRLSAARAVVSLCIRARENIDLAARVHALESIIGEGRN